MQFARNPNAPPLRPREEQVREQPHAYNEPAVVTLLAYRALEYDGRAYRVAPVSYHDGIRIMRLQYEISRQNEKKTDDEKSIVVLETVVREIVELGGRLLIPCGWRKHIPWRRNPLRNATVSELGQILGFLAMCRTMPSGRLSLAPAPRSRRT